MASWTPNKGLNVESKTSKPESRTHNILRGACGAWGAAGAALAGGACAAANARAGAPLRHRAALPLLAAYARAHTHKIRHRNALHAAYVSGGNTDDLHNKLEQASEALRSELSDWIPKTRAEVKSLLLELADRQVNTHAQTLAGWQQALRLATGSDVSEIFKTVSKTAVQNLSPSKCRADTPTDKDFEDLDNYSVEVSSENSISEVVNDSVVGNVDVHLESSASVQVNSDEKTEEKVSDPLQDFSEVDLS
ncbi:hypothetical protein RR46_08030 [Papilio xuthus]|uniref:Uncharacterized protein n=1 Tax=Papilio xuthus TaxID=66420 RepID=A0A194Q9P9_PAPXU|nr:hypothetical protein RR46_08030 [Papilio xuthus]